MRPLLAPLLALALALPALAQDDPLAPPRGEPTPQGRSAPPPPKASPPPQESAPPPKEKETKRKAGRDKARGRVLNLANRIGLTGFGDMIDARVPDETIALRGGIRYRLQVSEQEVDAGDREREVHEFPLYVGASLFGLLDAGLRASYLVRDEDFNVNGGPDGEDSESGWSDFELGAKGSIDLNPFAIGAYGQGRIPLDHDVTRLAYLDVGLTGTFALWDDRIGIHGNVGGIFIEEGAQALRYRVGASLVPLATDFLTLRAFAYLDGLEYEGSADSDIDLELGAQGILFGFLTVEISAGVRLVDSGYVDDHLRDELDAVGLVDRSLDDDGTWELELGAGLQFSF